MSEDHGTIGWAVAAWIERKRGEPLELVLYAATFPDAASAKELVRERFAAGPRDRVVNAYPLRAETVEALGMEPGECDRL